MSWPRGDFGEFEAYARHLAEVVYPGLSSQAIPEETEAAP